jgi:SNF2 family DNA or RNA helicase
MFAHQEVALLEHGDKEAWALFWDPGTGKTRAIIDTAEKLYREGKIDGMLVVAPNGVQRNWVYEEMPKHLSPDIAARTKAHVWRSSAAATERHKKATTELLGHKGFAVLTIGYESFITVRAKEFCKKFLTLRRVLFVADESHRIKTPGAKSTRTILAASKYAKYRRVLTGTPSTGNPFDVYSQVRFCDSDFWKPFGLSSFESFRTFFGIWEPRTNGQTGQQFNTCVGYQNLALLQKWLTLISTRVLKSDVLDLPPKLYSVRTFEMSSEQRRLYNALVSDFVVNLSGGQEISAPLAIVRMLRLQQVTCGYLPVEVFDEDGYPLDKKPLIAIDEKSTRLEALREICDNLPVGHKTIIWARFIEDINQIVEMLRSDKRNVVRYDGQVKYHERGEAIDGFQKGDVDFFVSNPAAGGTGITLHAAHTVIYYNNSFKLTDREQSEDRAHRAGLDHSVNYIDLVAASTVDGHILKSLREKISIAAAVTGDRLKEWVTLA